MLDLQIKYADIILNVCDIASEDRDLQLQITQGVLAEIGCEMENVITLSVPLTVECNYGNNWLEAH